MFCGAMVINSIGNNVRHVNLKAIVTDLETLKTGP